MIVFACCAWWKEIWYSLHTSVWNTEACLENKNWFIFLSPMLQVSFSDHTTNYFSKEHSFFGTSLGAHLSPGNPGQITPRNGNHWSLGQTCSGGAENLTSKENHGMKLTLVLPRWAVLLQVVLHGVGLTFPTLPQGHSAVPARAVALRELQQGWGAKAAAPAQGVTQKLFPPFGQKGPGPGHSEGKYLFPDSVFICTIMCLFWGLIFKFLDEFLGPGSWLPSVSRIYQREVQQLHPERDQINGTWHLGLHKGKWEASEALTTGGC